MLLYKDGSHADVTLPPLVMTKKTEKHKLLEARGVGLVEPTPSSNMEKAVIFHCQSVCDKKFKATK